MAETPDTETPDTETPDTEAPELTEFRVKATKWCDANFERRSVDINEFKRRFAISSISKEDEHAQVERAQAGQKLIFEAGFAGIVVPVEYGGQGLSGQHQRVFSKIASRYVIDTGIFSVSIGMVLPTLLAHGTEEQKLRLIPPMLRGDDIWCQLFSEPGAGSDLAGLTTKAELDGETWRINGQKVWNSFAHVANWGILLARTDWDVPKHRGISVFMVEMGSKGVEVRPLRQITGVAHFNETFLTDVDVPANNLLGDLNGGWGVTQTTLMAERSLIGGGMGLGFKDFVTLAKDYDRTDDLNIRQELAQTYTRFEILRWLGERSRAAMRAGKIMGAESSVTKLAISEHVAKNGDLALAIEGAAGMLAGDDASDFGFWQQQFLSQWAIRIGGGTEQVQRNILGERVLGLPPEARPDKTEPFRLVPKN